MSRCWDCGKFLSVGGEFVVQQVVQLLSGYERVVQHLQLVVNLSVASVRSLCPVRVVELSTTPVLADLHWLPVRYRIEYKIALITFKALTTQQPQYLSELIRHYETPRQLRSRGVNILQTTETSATAFLSVPFVTPHP